MEDYIKRFSALFCLVAVLTSNGTEAAVGADCSSSNETLCIVADNEVCVTDKCGCDSTNGYVGDVNCSLANCSAPTTPTNGDVDISGGTLYNNVATFSCNTGYTPEATVTSTCQTNKTWTPATHTCTIKDCETPPVPANSNVTLTVDGVTTYGANATVSCSTGFTCNGELTCAITCESSGWSSVVCSGAASIVSGVVLIGVCGLVSVMFHL